MVRQFGFLLIFLFAVVANASLTFWKPTGQNAIYVLPEKVSPARYLEALRKNQDLASFVDGMKLQQQDQVSIIKPHSKTANSRALLLANAQGDHNRIHPRLDQFGQHFDQTFVVPVGAAYPLNIYEREAFYRELAKHFGLLNPMGGDDVDTSLYGERKTWTNDTIRLRDELEAEIIRYFYFKSNRKIFAVCRGAQLTAVVLGAKLVQDNTLEIGNKENHQDGALHAIKLLPTRHNVYATIMKSVGSLIVNSYHHQSMRIESLIKTPLQVAAISPGGIVEAAESIDRRVLLTQSHPEKPDNKVNYSSAFFDGLKSWANMPVTMKSCKYLINSK